MMPPIDPPTDDTIPLLPSIDQSFDPAAHDPDYPGPDPVFLNDDPNPDPQGDVAHADDSFVNDPNYPGGVLDVISHGMTALSAWEAPGWLYTNDPGFYVHEGNVYVSGRAEAYSPSYMGSATLLTGIPPEYAPDSTVTGRVMIDHSLITYEYAVDSGLKMGPWLPVTITPQGDVTLDGGNPVRPPATSADFTSFGVILSSLTWPTGGQVYDAYGPTGYLDDFVASAAHIDTVFGDTVPSDIWMNFDGSYSAHDERFHLNGKVELLGDYGAYPYDALIGIPPQYGPRASSEASLSDWFYVAQKDGYLFMIAMPYGGYTRALYSNNGAQDPAAVGNLGCGFFAQYFSERLSDGFMARGSTTDVSWTTLGVLPGNADVFTADYIGCSGKPVGDLPEIADWVSNIYTVTVKFKLDDLIHAGVATYPINYATVVGDQQVSFICGMTSDMLSYYKVVYFYDQLNDYVYRQLLLEECGSARRGNLSYQVFHPGPRTDSDGYITDGWSFKVSPNPGDVGYVGASPPPGFNYWSFDGVPTRGTDYSSGVLTGTSGAVPSNPGPLKGDLGFYVHGAAQVIDASVSGLGSFPTYAPGDMIDLTNCGWPLI